MLYHKVLVCSGFTTDPANKETQTTQASVVYGVDERPALKDFSRGSEQLKVAIRSYFLHFYTLSAPGQLFHSFQNILIIYTIHIKPHIFIGLFQYTRLGSELLCFHCLG